MKNKKWEEQEIEIIKEMLEDNKTFIEVANVLNRSVDSVQRKAHRENLYSNNKGGVPKTEGVFEKEFNEKYEKFEYVSGYKNNISPVTIKCKECGSIFNRNASCVRGDKNIQCDECVKNEREDFKREKKRARLIKETIRLIKRFERLKAKEIKDKELQNQVCKECGEVFSNSRKRVYCSIKCMNTNNDRKKKLKKRMKAHENGIMDSTIGLGRLLKRDNGVCYLCGKKVNAKDFIISEEGYFIAGNEYPSIDHVQPVAKGGTHTWDNIKLAHKLCNSIKSDRNIEKEEWLNHAT